MVSGDPELVDSHESMAERVVSHTQAEIIFKLDAQFSRLVERCYGFGILSKPAIRPTESELRRRSCSDRQCGELGGIFVLPNSVVSFVVAAQLLESAPEARSYHRLLLRRVLIIGQAEDEQLRRSLKLASAERFFAEDEIRRSLRFNLSRRFTRGQGETVAQQDLPDRNLADSLDDSAVDRG